MCLAIPGKILETYDEAGLRMGRIDFSGTRQVACLEYVPEAQPGHYVLVHAGFALSVLDEQEAASRLALWSEMVQAGAVEGTDAPGRRSDGKDDS